MSKQIEALKLAKELDGVIADVEQGDGFDDVCLDTVKYVRDALAEQPAHVAAVDTSSERVENQAQNVHVQPAQQQEQKLEFVSPGGGYVPAIPRPMPLDWKLVPRKATPEMLKAMDECAQEGYDERLYAGMASSVYMAAWDASPVLGTLPPSEKERSMMDMIVGNLVREGINKHRARELAEHFIKHTSPQSKPWVGLTDEDIGAACGLAEHTTASTRFALKAISRAIEAKLKEKNA